jgi:superfamily II DNA helicase RecQ
MRRTALVRGVTISVRFLLFFVPFPILTLLSLPFPLISFVDVVSTFIGPDYKEMGHLKRDYPGVPLIALTATANSRVKTDVMTNLQMHNPVMLTQSFNRANLRYHVKKKSKNILADIADFIQQSHQGECGIIYCSSKKQCEDTAQRLRSQYKIKAMHYHAVRAVPLPSPFFPFLLILTSDEQGMDKNDRIRVQENWQAGSVHLICATIACVSVRFPPRSTKLIFLSVMQLRNGN